MGDSVLEAVAKALQQSLRLRPGWVMSHNHYTNGSWLNISATVNDGQSKVVVAEIRIYPECVVMVPYYVETAPLRLDYCDPHLFERLQQALDSLK